MVSSVMFCPSKLLFSCYYGYEPQRCQPPIPTIAAENSVRVLLWHSIRLASEFRSKQHPHHLPFAEHPQPIPVEVVEHSAIEQTQGAIRAPNEGDRWQSDIVISNKKETLLSAV